MPEETILICRPVSKGGYVLPGSVPMKCQRCGEPVRVSPSSFILMSDNPGMQILCTKCAFDRTDAGLCGEFQPLIPIQVNEIAEYLTGTGNHED